MAKKSAEKAAPSKATKALGAPNFRLRAVYVKDLSFESPLAPHAFGQNLPAPKIGLEINVGVKHLESSAFEVTLKIEAEAKLPDNKTLFLLELLQAAVFVINPDLDEKTTKKLLATECAAALFPFARQSVAELTRNGGFAPLILDQVEFAT